ncbi:uncharacterized protein METZ01_LOCUS315171, partial [marine metagenome]
MKYRVLSYKDIKVKSCFVIGPVKSGTTLLISLLDSHPELALFPM